MSVGAASERAAGSASSAGQIEEVVVTATRRPETIQEAALSVTQFSGEDIERLHIFEPRDLFIHTPGLFSAAGADKSSSLISARGLNTQAGGAVAADLPLTLLMDDVVYPRAGDMNPILFDVERVEVLRGPQGTLFGRNALGGAVAIVNRTPSHERAMTTSLTAAEGERYHAQGAINLPLADGRAASRISFSLQDSEGLVDNQLSSNDTVSDDHAAVRAQLLFDFNENLSLNLSGSYSSSEGRGYALRIAGDRPELFPDIATDKFTVDMPIDNDYEVDMSALIARLEWQVGPGTLTSITAFRKSENTSYRNAIALPVRSGYDIAADQTSEQLSQEVRYAFSTNKLDGVVGAYYLDDQADITWDVDFNLVPGTLAAAVFGTDPYWARYFQDLDGESYAVFGEVEYHLTDTVSAFVGARYTWDEKQGITTVDGSQIPLVAAEPVPLIAPFDDDWGELTPKMGLKWQPTDDLNFYAMYSKGYQAGGYGLSLPTAAGLAAGFDPQYADNYEVGFKGFFLDRRVQLNLTGYWMDISDLQVTVTEITASGGGSQRIANVGEARSRGIELESDFFITNDLRGKVSYAFNDAEFIDYFTGTVSRDGNTLPLAPEHSVALGLAYSRLLANGNDLSLNVDYIYRSRLQLHEANDVPDRVTDQSIQNTFDASLAYTFGEGQHTVSLWGKNLTNDFVLQYVGATGIFYYTPAEVAAGKKGYSGFYNTPREFGLTYTLRFE